MPFDKYKVAEARAHFSALLDRAKAGEEILITRGREPQARIVPPPEAARREPAPLAHPAPAGHPVRWGRCGAGRDRCRRLQQRPGDLARGAGRFVRLLPR